MLDETQTRLDRTRLIAKANGVFDSHPAPLAELPHPNPTRPHSTSSRPLASSSRPSPLASVRCDLLNLFLELRTLLCTAAHWLCVPERWLAENVDDTQNQGQTALRHTSVGKLRFTSAKGEKERQRERERERERASNLYHMEKENAGSGAPEKGLANCQRLS